MIDYRIGDCRQILKEIPDGTAYCCVTSPPYWGLRDYENDAQIGIEKKPQEFVRELVSVFAEVRRVIRDDGTLWVNIGETYIEKNMVGIPWRVAFALQEDGWFLRSDIIWNKPNAMPEGVTDRPTKSYEHIFLLSKSKDYYYDCDAIREPFSSAEKEIKRQKKVEGKSKYAQSMKSSGGVGYSEGGRNKRDVWSVNTTSYKGDHFAVYPPELIRPCILAGCPSGGTVLDPFGGSGTTGMVAESEGRNAILIELNPDYMKIAKKRTSQSSLLSPV